MKLYHIFFIIFIIQILFILPFQRNIEVWNQSISEEAYNYLRSNGIGPVSTYPGTSTFTEIGPNGGNGGFSQIYLAFYIGNTAMNFMLLVCVVILYKLRK
jgi:hypothetical protein